MLETYLFQKQTFHIYSMPGLNRKSWVVIVMMFVLKYDTHIRAFCFPSDYMSVGNQLSGMLFSSHLYQFQFDFGVSP